MPLTAEAVAALTAKGLTLATAEATTGGLIGHLLPEIPGNSRVFPGGVAPYANSLKQAIGVPTSLLAEYGAVSREARRSAGQRRSRSGRARRSASLRPGSPAPEALAPITRQASSGSQSRTGARSERFVFEGDRSENRRACAEAALRKLLDALSGT